MLLGQTLHIFDMHNDERSLVPIGYEEFPAGGCSFYRLIDKYFNGERPESPIHRLFSLARRENVKSVVVEKIECGLHAMQENYDLKQAGLNVSEKSKSLYRISFWDSKNKSDESFIGYAIFKYGPILHNKEKWRVFESVFRKYKHKNNCVHSAVTFPVFIINKKYHIVGVLYAQQNGYNCCCAHVALRSLLASYMLDKDITYRTINRYAAYQFNKEGGCSKDSEGHCNKGLTNLQIASVLEKAEVPFRQYRSKSNTEEFQVLLHSGIESGSGVLLAINEYGEPHMGHAISLYGHTFNTDSWLAFGATQKEKRSYMQGSHMLTSSYLMHDDNFGCNYCVPKSYVNDTLKGIAFVLLPKGYKTTGDWCLAKTQIILMDLQKNQKLIQNIAGNYWTKVSLTPKTHIFLRPIAINRCDYISHMLSAVDGQKRKIEISEFVMNKLLNLPNKLWMIEFFNYDLISGNNSKLGEALFSAINQNPTKCKLLRICGCFGFDFEEVKDLTLKIEDSIFSYIQVFSKDAIEE